MANISVADPVTLEVRKSTGATPGLEVVAAPGPKNGEGLGQVTVMTPARFVARNPRASSDAFALIEATSAVAITVGVSAPTDV
jgi:hypothetical protein